MTEGIVGFDDAARIGFKVTEMAERLMTMDRITPGAAARWHFEMDDVRFEITMRRAFPAERDER